MKRTPEQIAKAKERRRREATFPKCWCGNVAGVGQTLCGRHRHEAEPKPDPLVEAIEKCAAQMHLTSEDAAKEFRAALDALGFEIREKGQ
jgi:hypothetical protein